MKVEDCGPTGMPRLWESKRGSEGGQHRELDQLSFRCVDLREKSTYSISNPYKQTANF